MVVSQRFKPTQKSTFVRDDIDVDRQTSRPLPRRPLFRLQLTRWPLAVALAAVLAASCAANARLTGMILTAILSTRLATC